ncbi:hypothetical protein OH76DRAFT_1408091 [Lentinus brumalis]|uniref:Uncharacterized protein n=1 Tax=Lentinus brumalis TaxID=2498619 RepID=A0A371CYF3_9APHY|nr:hypothetical protein OH76DRAFT_1408091 [Polyporus brumalis]
MSLEDAYLMQTAPDTLSPGSIALVTAHRADPAARKSSLLLVSPATREHRAVRGLELRASPGRGDQDSWP